MRELRRLVRTAGQVLIVIVDIGVDNIFHPCGCDFVEIELTQAPETVRADLDSVMEFVCRSD